MVVSVSRNGGGRMNTHWSFQPQIPTPAFWHHAGRCRGWRGGIYIVESRKEKFDGCIKKLWIWLHDRCFRCPGWRQSGLAGSGPMVGQGRMGHDGSHGGGRGVNLRGRQGFLVWQCESIHTDMCLLPYGGSVTSIRPTSRRSFNSLSGRVTVRSSWWCHVEISEKPSDGKEVNKSRWHARR